MGLLSKLFGKEAEKAAADVFKTLVNNTASNASNTSAQAERPVPTNTAPAQAAPAYEEGPSGFSWGPNMPAEENQYNFNGSYIQYFEGIFNTEFSDYRVVREEARYNAQIFTFWQNDRKALVVELLPKSSCAKKLRADCRAQGIPYLRYYIDYEGWWNTRAYVVTRTRNALNG